VGSHAAVLEGNLDGALRGPDIDFLMDERVGDTVVMLVEFDVVVNVDPGLVTTTEYMSIG